MTLLVAGLLLTGSLAACSRAEPAVTFDSPAPGPTSTPEPTTEPVAPSPTTTPVPTETLPTAKPCPVQEAGGLITELQRIGAEMPGPESEGMRVPSVEQMLAWGVIIDAASRDDLETACRILGQQAFPYQVVEFTDLPHQSERVVLIRESLPVTAGWGTYVLRPAGARDLLIEVPHPLEDSRTRTEGVVLFRSLAAKALLVSGAHRCANAAAANCGGTTIACGQVGPYRESDVAHATLTIFQAAHQALAPCSGESLTLQLHGNSLTTCPDLFISNGSTQPGEISRELHQEVRRACPDRTVDLADGTDGECGFYGNGAQASYHALCAEGWDVAACPDTLRRPVGAERYLSLEQSWELRQDYACLVTALERTLQ